MMIFAMLTLDHSPSLRHSGRDRRKREYRDRLTENKYQSHQRACHGRRGQSDGGHSTNYPTKDQANEHLDNRDPGVSGKYAATGPDGFGDQRWPRKDKAWQTGQYP